MVNFKLSSINKSMASIAVLLFWICAQVNIVAHEIAVDHSIDSHCEWQCKTNKQDDLIPNSENTESHAAFFQYICSNYRNTYLNDTDFSRPLLRGPPTIL